MEIHALPVLVKTLELVMLHAQIRQLLHAAEMVYVNLEKPVLPVQVIADALLGKVVFLEIV